MVDQIAPPRGVALIKTTFSFFRVKPESFYEQKYFKSHHEWNKVKKNTSLWTTISHKNSETRLPCPLIQCWLQIGCSFLVFIALHGFFRLGTTLSQGEGGFWVTLSKPNVFLWIFLWKYSESQLFLSLLVARMRIKKLIINSETTA